MAKKQKTYVVEPAFLKGYLERVGTRAGFIGGGFVETLPGEMIQFDYFLNWFQPATSFGSCSDVNQMPDISSSKKSMECLLLYIDPP